jgi:hypothetical protein
MHGSEMHTKVWSENLKGNSLEDLRMDRPIIKWTLNRATAGALVEWVLVLFHIQGMPGSNLSQ